MFPLSFCLLLNFDYHMVLHNKPDTKHIYLIFSVDGMAVDQITAVGKLTVSKMSIDEIIVDEMAVD